MRTLFGPRSVTILTPLRGLATGLRRLLGAVAGRAAEVPRGRRRRHSELSARLTCCLPGARRQADIRVDTVGRGFESQASAIEMTALDRDSARGVGREAAAAQTKSWRFEHTNFPPPQILKGTQRKRVGTYDILIKYFS